MKRLGEGLVVEAVVRGGRVVGLPVGWVEDDPTTLLSDTTGECGDAE